MYGCGHTGRFPHHHDPSVSPTRPRVALPPTPLAGAALHFRVPTTTIEPLYPSTVDLRPLVGEETYRDPIPHCG